MGEMRRTEATGESLRPRKVSSRLTRHSRTASQPIAPSCSSTPGTDGWTCAAHAMPTPLEMSTIKVFGESGLLENEPTVPAEQAHTTQRQ